MGLRITWRASFPGAKCDPPPPWESSSCSSAGGEHDDRDKRRRDRRGQDRRSPVSRLEDRKRDEAGVRHRGGPSLHCRPRKPLAAKTAQRCKDDCEAQERAAAKSNQKPPRQEGSPGLVCFRDNQQRRHRDVIGEVYQGVGQVAREVSQAAGEPSGHDHREHRQDEIDDLHCLRAGRLATAIVFRQCHAEAICAEADPCRKRLRGQPCRARMVASRQSIETKSGLEDGTAVSRDEGRCSWFIALRTSGSLRGANFSGSAVAMPGSPNYCPARFPLGPNSLAARWGVAKR
jgi:hypothetical protein